MQTLNSPLEIGLRVLAVLTEAFPASLDLDRLMLLDYCLIHSADFAGPPSIQVPVSTRSGELGIKRSIVDHGVQLMMRAGMVELEVSAAGITYRATESAAPFLQLVRSPMLGRLQETALWVTTEFADLPNDEIRSRIRRITAQWAEEWSDGRLDRSMTEYSVGHEEESTL